MHIQFSDLSPAQVYAAMTQAIIPRPIAWVLSENQSGSYNIAPFSYFNAMSSDPPMVVISVGRKNVEPFVGDEKDTRVNIKERKHFVVHIAHREQAAALTQTAATLGGEDSEVDRLGFELADMPGSVLPRISDCRLAFACELMDTQSVGDQDFIFGRVTDLYVDDQVVGKDAKGRIKIMADKVDPLGRLGGGEYVTFGEVLTVERPA